MNPQEAAASVARELVSQGARAVVLMGSHARGEPLPHSDVDLIALGDGPEYRLERRGGHLVAIAWTTTEKVERDFASPGKAGWVVQGWRDAVAIIDPSDAAGRIQQQALSWSWSEIGDDACNAYVAEEMTSYAEEVHKLVNLLESGNLTGAAVQRSVLALRLAKILGVHLRLLYASENELWSTVGAELGERWQTAQDAALGLGNEEFHDTCLAALDLYRCGVGVVEPLLDERQRSVISGACAMRPRAGT